MCNIYEYHALILFNCYYSLKAYTVIHCCVFVLGFQDTSACGFPGQPANGEELYQTKLYTL
jgi:hypothetical protein